MRLIDADALRNVFDAMHAIPGGSHVDHLVLLGIKKHIDDAPTIDAEHVRHARWVKTKFDEYVCSLCGEEAPNDGFNCGAKYCYECGAKMDAKE